MHLYIRAVCELTSSYHRTKFLSNLCDMVIACFQIRHREEYLLPLVLFSLFYIHYVNTVYWPWFLDVIKRLSVKSMLKGHFSRLWTQRCPIYVWSFAFPFASQGNIGRIYRPTAVLLTGMLHSTSHLFIRATF